MKYTLVGFSNYSFKGADGSDIVGVNLCFTYEDKNVIGLCCKQFGCSDLSLLPSNLEACIGHDFFVAFKDRVGKSAALLGMIKL